MSRTRIATAASSMITLLAAMLLGAPQARAGQFFQAPQYSVNGMPQATYVGDFNGDGKPDLAVSTYSPGGISILLGRGDGTFQTYQELAANNDGVAVGDFNGDGYADLALSDIAAGVINIYLSKGDGTFRLFGSITANSPGVLATADLNGDGKLDLVSAITSRQAQGVSVFLGNGDGTFRAGKDDIFGRSARQLQIVDLNQDGKLDVLALVNPTTQTTRIRVLLGNGDGSFQPPIDSLVIAESGTAAIADFNADGHLDVAVEDDNSNSTVVVFGTGDGNFRHSRSFVTGAGPRAVVAADFNGDGKMDLATSNYGDNTVSILLGNGDGAFQSHQDYIAGQTPLSLTAGDFNLDGKPDLVTPSLASFGGVGTVAVLIGNGDGALQTNRDYVAAEGPHSITSGDFNGDGHPDLVVASVLSHFLSVLMGKNDGTFGNPRLIDAGFIPQAVAIGDFNHDGKLDMVSASNGASNGVVSVFLGNGDGTFQPRIDAALAQHPSFITVGDFNKDGKIDVAVEEFGTGVDIAVLLGNGDGTLQSPQTYNISSTNTTGVTANDVNGDGKVDLVTSQGNFVAVLLGNGDGTFQPQIDSDAGLLVNGFALGDLNKDGKLDVVVAGTLLGVMLGNGDGTFQAPTYYNPGGRYVIAGDFNKDGHVDVAFTDGLSSFVSFMLGNGDGTLRAYQNYTVGTYPEGLTAADFNGDRYPDLAVANSGAALGNTITVLLNIGGASPEKH